MLFNSLAFAFFFPIVTVGYFLIAPRFRWLWLVAASAVFYMAFVPAYILVLCAVIAVDYVAGLLIERSAGPRRKALLAISIVSNVGLLAIFKYWNFIAENVGVLARLGGHVYTPPLLAMVLPIGLSFHTFQSMSYTIEVYRGAVRAERHLGIFALYVLFYPQLVAGPIERPQNLLHQFHDPKPFLPEKVVSGLRLMLWGLVKKVLVADHVAEVVNRVFDNPRGFSGPTLLIAAYCFSIQIYGDFSGYSDIARGCARVMGYDLMVNFRQPYFATGMGDFWRRWHVSLSTWFRDYVYVPLGGGRNRFRNVMIVFLLSGLWHGAAWHYVIWGAVNGLFVALDRGRHARVTEATVASLPRMILTFHLSTLCWVLFRAESTMEAIHVFRGLLHGWSTAPLATAVHELDMSRGRLGALAVLVTFLFAVDWSLEVGRLGSWFTSRPRWVRWSAYYGSIVLLVFFGSSANVRFIYFQF